MKTIKGPARDNWSHKFTCRKCKAVMIADKSDIVLDATDPREPTWFYVLCPHCKTPETVDPPG